MTVPVPAGERTAARFSISGAVSAAYWACSAANDFRRGPGRPGQCESVASLFPVHAIKAETGNSFPDCRALPHSRHKPLTRRAEIPGRSSS
ncbi:predicted protein [Streptomyces sp. AA4]|nr:predicted protein [Streptomyces sp. AA4]